MNNCIGIRREDLSKTGEMRVALTPQKVAGLVREGYRVLIQSGVHPQSGEVKRGFMDEAYAKAGAILTEDLSPADVIFGLKEVETESLIAGKPYLMFSHTHKGQVKNRGMLQVLVDNENTLIDYELIVDEKGQRVVTAFTFFAGYAGMVDSLWTLGTRWEMEGIANPFSNIPQSVNALNLDEAKEVVAEAGQRIRSEGTPAKKAPVIICFLGNGKTSHGAQEIFDLLPHESIGMDQLPEIHRNGSRNQVYKLVIDIPEMYRLKPDSSHTDKSLSYDELFSLYLKEPGEFESNLDGIFPYVTMFLNCILWAPNFPRLITREDARMWYPAADTLEVIGDITCDPEGAIQFSKETWIDRPVFIYDPMTGSDELGFEGEGIAVMAVTNLPCEFPMDSSAQFADDLGGLLGGIAAADYYSSNVRDSGLPDAIQKAVILWRGKFTPDYSYMQEFLEGA